jgi:hypothetical protein
MTRREHNNIIPRQTTRSSMIDMIGTFLFPETVYPNRTIEPSGNNVIIVRNNNMVYLFDVDGTILRTYEENGMDSN